MDASYKSVNNSQQAFPASHPYGSGDPYYAESTGYITPQSAPQKRGMSNWIKIGVPVLILAIVGAVVGGVLGSRASKTSSASDGGSQAGASDGSPGSGSSGKSFNMGDARFATATDSQWLEPLYPSTTNDAVLTTPTFRPTSNNVVTWPEDSFKPANPSAISPRQDRPRLIAPSYKWQALPQLIAKDPYLKGWNDTIFGNATQYFNQPPVKYFLDDGSGILDNARDVKRRVKLFSYAYRMTNDTRWVDRTWTELQNAANNGSEPWGTSDDLWNTKHFLDTAELSAAFGIAYDWLYDIWTDEQKSMIRFTLLKYGLQPGLLVYTNPNDVTYGWWANKITGNWNCVSNGGLILGSLAILGDDDTGTAQQILNHAIGNAKQGCAYGVTTDGSWTETANYWYFGTTGHAEMSSALLTATGSHYGIVDVNPNFWKTGQYHMHVNGPGSLFSYGDHGPNKYSSTANSMFFYANQYQQPSYALFQRDQFDAAEPWSMFWYNPDVAGAFWNGAPLDRFFDDADDQWASMRTSWTDNDAFVIGIKAGRNINHQTHNDLDCGDFVMDALGTRWAGELGSADYNSPGYFNSGDQDSDRWKYYRKMTEGQNTLLVGRNNQLITASPTVRHGTTNETQGSSTVYNVPDDSTAFFVADMTTAYDKVQSVMRGMRFLNKRRQVLLQDEINASDGVDWRMHTNATVETSGTSATLKLNGQQLKITMLDPPQGATFTTGPAERFSTDPPPPIPDQPNPGVTVLSVTLPAGQYTLQMLFNPQWPGMKDSDFVTPKTVPLAQWDLQSHN